MTVQPRAFWRWTAAGLWIVSVICLVRALSDGIAAEQPRYDPTLTPSELVAIRHLGDVAARWAVLGWILQMGAAAVLSAGIESTRVVRRIFVSLGILIGANGVLMLLMAVIVRI